MWAIWMYSEFGRANLFLWGNGLFGCGRSSAGARLVGSGCVVLVAGRIRTVVVGPSG